jgi:hypothetical protein
MGKLRFEIVSFCPAEGGWRHFLYTPIGVYLIAFANIPAEPFTIVH